MAPDDIKGQLGNAVGDAANKAKEIGDKVVEDAQRGIDAAVKMIHDTQQELRIKKYNPLFPEEYNAADFDLPKMVVIVDEDERKGIDVCEGAIGWLSKQDAIEVIHLYEEFIPDCGLKFHPRPTCYGVYYVDPFDSKRYISLSSYFDVAQQDRCTELRNIAFMLGAKSCKLMMREEEKSITIEKRGGGAKVKSANGPAVDSVAAEADTSSEQSQYTSRAVLLDQDFGETREPRRPTLEWFQHDNEILSLITMRCDEGWKSGTYRCDLDKKSTETMSSSFAGKLDVAVKKLGAKGNVTLEGEAKDESRKSMTFEVVF